MHAHNTHGRTLNTLQALRAWAAVSVVLFHVVDKAEKLFAQDAGRFGILHTFGPLGVDIFFVISGFIMLYTTRSLPQNWVSVRLFLRRRIERIVPLYWLATTLVLLLVLFVPSVFAQLRWDPHQAIASYLFVPVTNAMGDQSPLVGVGWTLNFEMYFYVVFAIILMLRKRLLALCLFFGASVLIGGFLNPVLPITQLMTNPLLLEFVAGAAAATWVIARPHIPGWMGIVGVIGLVLAAIYARYMTLCPLYYGLSIALILATLVSLEMRNKLTVPRWLIALGDSSYSLYLSHVFGLAVAAQLLRASGMAIGFTGFVILTTPALILGGYLVYRLVERPITNWLKRKA